MQLGSGLSGKEVAQKMLQDHGIYDVQVMSTEGQLSDHYNPQNRTVNLSTDVFHGRSVAAAAVAAHECGHAIQDSKRYKWLYLRSEMVPVELPNMKMPSIIFHQHAHLTMCQKNLEDVMKEHSSMLIN